MSAAEELRRHAAALVVQLEPRDCARLAAEYELLADMLEMAVRETVQLRSELQALRDRLAAITRGAK